MNPLGHFGDQRWVNGCVLAQLVGDELNDLRFDAWVVVCPEALVVIGERREVCFDQGLDARQQELAFLVDGPQLQSIVDAGESIHGSRDSSGGASHEAVFVSGVGESLDHVVFELLLLLGVEGSVLNVVPQQTQDFGFLHLIGHHGKFVGLHDVEDVGRGPSLVAGLLDVLSKRFEVFLQRHGGVGVPERVQMVLDLMHDGGIVDVFFVDDVHRCLVRWLRLLLRPSFGLKIR